MNGDALSGLRRAAAAGDTAAMTRLGAQLLVGAAVPASPLEGAQMLAAAAEQGGAEACAIVSNLLAAGSVAPQSWPRAFDYLVRAGELGLEPARAQLALLTSDCAIAMRLSDGAPADREFWKALRYSIDIDRLTAVPTHHALRAAPRIAAIEDFIPESFCDWLMSRAQPRLHRAQTYDPDTGGPASTGARTNSETDFSIVESDIILLLTRARIAAATGYDTAQMELSNVLHYAPGQQFNRHFDYLDPNNPALARDIARRGQRVATCLIYLNDAYRGGETEFALADLRHKGRKGDAAFFVNVGGDGKPDRSTLHAGLPTTEGEKWLLSQFIRGPAGPDNY